MNSKTNKQTPKLTDITRTNIFKGKKKTKTRTNKHKNQKQKKTKQTSKRIQKIYPVSYFKLKTFLFFKIVFNEI